MINFPFFRFPYSKYYYPYYNNYIQHSKLNVSENISENFEEKKEIINSPKKEYSKEKRSSRNNSWGPISFINPFTENINEDEPVLEILGLKLYLDDLIILGLLFLLYKEDVQDETLFLALLLLLLT